MVKQAISSPSPAQAELDASKLRTTLTSSPRAVPALDSSATAASNICTDHMITASWTSSAGWAAPELRPYGPISLMPTASVLHYATECFEGLKLYRGHDNVLRLFRVDRNCQRMVRSATRIALPRFDPAELEKLIVALCARDGAKWLPRDTHKGRFLYLRPTLIADEPTLGVQVPKQALLFVILTVFPDMSNPQALGAMPNGAEGDDGIRGLRLLASREDTIRAWPGGFGFAKLGANYGPSLLAQGEARARGFNQILWLFGQEGYVTEAGASNFFVVWRSKEGRTELVTAPLDEGVILEGVTRASILEMARERLEGVEVVERKYTMAEVQEALDEGRLVEAFAAGTAFFVAPVGLIEWRGRGLQVPMEQGTTGKYAASLRGWLSDIMYGNVEHAWGKVVKEE
ncbi:branched-chain amino acid aminotransferase II [Myriangium duriaei CBS 260.36]|uniref:Branched-chain-amino-acid aminotransferase n=1 Tax=Myriangium duriaei CBS 260.36 TaxID=1168546 RepID=A0A9P4MND9_9PEZI|nr:branched-chain amino acid aminotransferase II [Myriangium duriaei CBS 260.36]